MKTLSFKKSILGVVMFLVLFFCISRIFHLPLTSQKGCVTEETNGTLENIGYISDLNPVYQSLYFHKPVRLHSMEVYTATYGNPIQMQQLDYSVLDSRGRELFSSSIYAPDIQDNSYVHIDLGDVRLRANERYFVYFHGFVENETVTCPTFYTMDSNSLSDYLHIGTVGVIARGKALRATYSYDVVPMGYASVLFFVGLFALCLLIANFSKSQLLSFLNKVPAYTWMVLGGILLLFVFFQNDPTTLELFPLKRAQSTGIALLIALLLIMTQATKFSSIKTLLKTKTTKFQSILGFLNRNDFILYLVYFGILFFFQHSLCAMLYQKIGGWDPQYIWDNVSDWLMTENPVTTEYMQAYPNNIAICTAIYWIRFLFKSFSEDVQYHAVVVANILMIDLGIFLAGRISKRVFGNLAQFFCVVSLTLLMGFSGYLIVPYTDTFSFWIPVCILYLYFKLLDSHKTFVQILLALCTGILAYLGYRMKPQCIIVLIAIGCILALQTLCLLIKNKSFLFHHKKKIACSLLSFVLGIAMGFGIFTGVTKPVLPADYSSENAKPMAHFFMMGMSENPRSLGIGGFCYDDVFYTDEKQLTAERANHNKIRIQERLKDYGVSGYLNHIFKKAIFVLGDGSFYWQKENQCYIADYSYKEGSQKQQELREKYYGSYGGYDSYRNGIFLGTLSGIWFVLLFFTLFAPQPKHNTRNRIATIALAVLGCLLFTLIFEGRSRYLILYLPLFGILASGGFTRIYKQMQCILLKIRKTKPEEA